jgi:hypothetical protein
MDTFQLGNSRFELQAVLFDKNNFTTTSARRWLKDHSLVPIKMVHKTKHYLRYRIRDPAQFNQFIEKPILLSRSGDNLIILVLGKFVGHDILSVNFN